MKKHARGEGLLHHIIHKGLTYQRSRMNLSRSFLDRRIGLEKYISRDSWRMLKPVLRQFSLNWTRRAIDLVAGSMALRPDECGFNHLSLWLHSGLSMLGGLHYSLNLALVFSIALLKLLRCHLSHLTATQQRLINRGEWYPIHKFGCSLMKPTS